MFSSQLISNIRDTPHKKVKLNEYSTQAHSSNNSRKISILDRMEHVRADKTQSFATLPFEVSQFELPELPFEYKGSNDSVESMEEQLQERQTAQLSLNRKFTLQLPEHQEQLLNTLNLYRNNSTCQQTRKKQEINLGDNIYLKRLNSMQQSARVESGREGRLRIEQDYDIERNFRMAKRPYTQIDDSRWQIDENVPGTGLYVKKITMSSQSPQTYHHLQPLLTHQIKIYHTDPIDHFLRFYQQWLQQNALYLTFEVAIESLADANSARNRLREIEVWDLLRDCTAGLKWLQEQHGWAHLNIKPGNVLKCQDKFKLGDPYCSVEVLKGCLERQKGGNRQYLAPEIRNFSLLLEGLDFQQADIYSLALCVIQNLLGEKYLPLEGKALRSYLQKHLHGYSPSLLRVLMRMLSLNPQKRPRAQELGEINKKEIRLREAPKRRRRFSI